MGDCDSPGIKEARFLTALYFFSTFQLPKIAWRNSQIIQIAKARGQLNVTATLQMVNTPSVLSAQHSAHTSAAVSPKLTAKTGSSIKRDIKVTVIIFLLLYFISIIIILLFNLFVKHIFYRNYSFL
jgi:hypothetical protein